MMDGWMDGWDYMNRVWKMADCLDFKGYMIPEESSCPIKSA